MRTALTTTLLFGALCALPTAGFGATSKASQAPAATKQGYSHATATHATRGVVTSVNDSTLVISHGSRKKSEMTFSLNSSTMREGTIAVGKPVSVRYRKEGKTNLATAIQAETAGQQAAHTSTQTQAPKR